MTPGRWALVAILVLFSCPASACAISAWWQRNSTRLDAVIRDAHLDPGRAIGVAKVVDPLEAAWALPAYTPDQVDADVADNIRAFGLNPGENS